MIQITPQMRLLLAVEPVDFRKGIDGLAQVCRQKLNTDPMAGALFVFASRSRKSIKILAYDGQGFWICQKRLSQGRFAWWPGAGQPAVLGLEVHQLQSLLWNGNPSTAKTAPLWRPLTPAA
jgi:hypothetical protein